MGIEYLGQPLLFLIDTLFSLYVFALLLRFLLQLVEADFYNPVSQFLVKITHPLLRPLRRVLPSVGRVDSASIALVFIVQILAGYLIFTLQGLALNPVALSVWALLQILDMLFNLYIYGILVVALLSWFATATYNPAIKLLHGLMDPVLDFFRGLIPAIGGVDLSPMAAFVALQVLKMLITPPLQQLLVVLG
ncbi:YggT family protein [Candidatus Methylospira mobilis]|uniref:YggT family protein n=1 Tax=Candidatus Methylospira mobilis TaxID=1808979 RepID=A0A5Q0BP29_9GAMM|nr:YggT family protein [Candidatus Methylospira mobilis]QFY43848.1 YggT family protein [Candidatus Methylospira mobilis]WNV04844.1 YggT family protein [Candidatus Methylospira mobilis]